MANAAMMKMHARMRKLFDGITNRSDEMAIPNQHDLFENKGQYVQPIVVADPMVKFLEEQVAKLEARLRASEAHCRRYAVACGKYRSAAQEGLTVVRMAVSGTVTLDESAAEAILSDILDDFNTADALIDPVATEVVS